jgi:hypothetical protein
VRASSSPLFSLLCRSSSHSAARPGLPPKLSE